MKTDTEDVSLLKKKCSETTAKTFEHFNVKEQQ